MGTENFTLEVGQTADMEGTVAKEHTARHLGSGKSDVLATPALIAWMEATAQKIVERHVPADWQSVGTYIALRHNGATQMGRPVQVRVVLTDIQGKELFFEIIAFDGAEKIAEGVHQRILAKTDSLRRLFGRKKQNNTL